MAVATIGAQSWGCLVPHKLPKYVRVKPAKGKLYYYFDTGTANDAGKAILKRLPDLRDPSFGGALATAQAARTKRQNAAEGMLTVTGLADLFERSQDFRTKAKSTQDSYRLYLRAIRERLDGAPANEVEPQDVRLIQDHLAETPGAANQFVRTLQALYAWGRKRGHVKARPTDDVALLESKEYEPWPAWLLEEALADPEVQLEVATLYFTAQRIGDVCRFAWHDIKDGTLHMRQEKTGKALAIPVHQKLAEIYARTARTGITILMAPTGRAWRAEALRLKLQAWAKAKGQKVVPHGLRKNAVIALLEIGCSAAETAAISGQSLQMIEHYAKTRNQAHLAGAAILRWNKA